MGTQQINRVTAVGVVALSGTALLMVLTAGLPWLLSGQKPPVAEDEGTAAHIFQLVILLLAPTTIVFLATANWRRPQRSVWPVALAFAPVVAAFVLLYFLEH